MHAFPPTQSLAAMLAAARLGSLSKAAEELGVTHGAISRRVHELEQWLGAPIFERHGRGVRLTPVGAKLAKRVERSMASVTAMARDIRTSRGPSAVRMSVLPSFARLWLVPNLRRLQGEPADLDLQITTEHRVASLEAREVDLAVRTGRGDWPNSNAQRLFNDTLYPVGHPSLVGRDPKAQNALLGLPLLHDGGGDDWRRWISAADLAYQPAAGEHRFDDYDLVLAAAAAGAGVALARMPLARRAVERDGLVRLPGPEISLDRAHWLVARPTESRGPVLRVIQRMLDIAREERSGNQYHEEEGTGSR